MLGRRLDAVTISYGVAHLGKISFWYAGEILLAYYLSEVCGLPPARMALILASSLLLSAAADLAMARVLRDRLASAAQAARLQMRGAVVASLALPGLFLGTYVPADLRLGYGFAFAAAFRLGYALLDLPQNVLMSIATEDHAGRSRLASLRLAMTSVGALLVSAALVPLMSRQIAVPVAARFAVLALALSMLALGGAFALQTSVEASLAKAPAPPGPAAERRAGLLQGAPIWGTVALAFVIALAWSCFTRVAPFYAAYYLSGAWWTIYVLPAAALGAAFSQPLWVRCALRMPGRRLLGIGAVTLGLAAMTFSHGAGHPVTALAAACFVGAASSGIGMMLWASFAGMVARQPGASAALAFGTLTAVQKVALACGATGIGAVLSAIDYRHGEAAALVQLMAMPAVAAALCVLLASAATGNAMPAIGGDQ